VAGDEIGINTQPWQIFAKKHGHVGSEGGPGFSSDEEES
jgi:hypothetical protein